MNMLNCPIISTDVRIMRFFSFILKADAMRYVCIIPVGLNNLFMLVNIYQSWGNFEELIISSFFTALWTNAVLRTVIVVLNREKYEHFLENIATVYKETEAVQDLTVQKIVSCCTWRARMLSFVNLGLGFFIDVCILLYPLFVESRKLPNDIFIPAINVLDSPYYEMLYAIQALWLVPANCMYVPFSNLFFSATLFGLVQIKTLQHKLTTLKTNAFGKDADNLSSAVNKLIEEHLRIIDYVKEFNSLFTYTCFIEFILFGIMLSGTLFHIITTDSQSQIVIAIIYVLAILFEVFLVYWHANEVREESVKIAEAAYNGPWIEMDNSVKKKLLLISLRAQRPLEIKLGNIFPMTLEMFQSLLNTSYSYCTLLRRVNN